MSNEPNNKRLMQKALLELRDLKAKLAAVEAEKREPIAIIGMGCRFPGAENPTAFWQLLRDGVDAIGEIPADRWDVDAHYDPDPEAPQKMYVREGGYLPDVYHFDPAFFGIPPREVATMDPQQRLLLEVCWETLEDAGIVPGTLEQSETGVYIGYMNRDYVHTMGDADTERKTDPYTLTGNSFSFVAGRISYLLGLQGPSMVVATACSSSLVTVHLACQALRAGECDLALAGGVNLILHPAANVMLSKLRAISPDGRCKTFDAAADGYGRGEGCGMVALKRLSDALADGDRILGVVRGSATNHDGPSAGLTVPNGPAQEKLLHKALAAAEVTPDVVDYVEAHGTGTELGDPIEINSLVKVFGQRRAKPLWVGSVKTNVGHLEAAAGIVGLIKVLLAFQEEVIPPHLHFDNPNPLVAWDDIPVQVTDSLTPWPKGDQPRIAGVSSFGLSGINAHLIIEEAPVQASAIAEAALPSLERPLHLLPLSAKSEPALQALVQQYQAYFAANPDLSFSDVCYTAAARREHFSHRIAIVADSHTSASMALANVEASSTIAMPKVAFLFTGQGSQYINMGRELYQSQPTFRAALDRCDEILQPILGRSLLEIIYTADQSTNRPTDAGLLDQTAYTQPALFALEYALAELWQSWGVKPALVMGHSVGEYVAACVAGLFTLTDGLKLIAARGRLMQALPQAGSMVVIGASAADVVDAIAPYLDEVSIAAVNGPQNVVISGESVTVQLLAASFTDRGIKTTPLTVSHAFHSPLMAPMLADFRAVAEQVHYATPQTGFVSNVTGGLVHDEVASADYWCQHIRQPVRFAEGMATLAAQDVTAFVEVGPKPVLLGMGRPNLPDGNQLWLPTLRPEQEWRQLLTTLGALYTHGVAIDWQGVDRDYKRHRLALPTYPFQRKPYGVWGNRGESTHGTHSAFAATDVSRWLTEGNTEQLAQLIAQKGALSTEQQALLPELLSTLIQEHQAQIAATQKSHDDAIVGENVEDGIRDEVVINQATPLWDEWQTTDDADRHALLAAALEAQIGRVLGYTQADAPVLAHDVPLLNLGLDSLMGFELRNWLQGTLRIDVEVVDILSGPSIALLAEQLHQQLCLQQSDETIGNLQINSSGPTPAARSQNYPLSYGQQALWFIHQSAPESAAYNVGLAFRLHAALDVDVLQQAFQQLVDRHPSLRTTFSTPGVAAPASADETATYMAFDETVIDLVQIVHPYLAVDFMQINAHSTASELAQSVHDAYAEPFDLAHGPLMRVRLFSTTPDSGQNQASDADEHVLLIAFHHIICDAWSTWTLLRELWTIYPALKAGTSLPLPLRIPLTATYRDHVEHEAAEMAGAEGKHLWAYWQQQLADANTVLELPTDYPRPLIQTYHGASQTLALNADLTQALRELARSENATLYMIMLAAWQLLLHRYTGQDDILVGSAMAGRSQTQLADVVGYFVNPVVMRARFEDNPTFRHFLQQVRTTALGAFAHQEYPYPLLVSQLQPGRDPSRSPLFQVDFTLQKLPPIAEQLKRGNLMGSESFAVEPFALDEEEGQFDLSLHIFDEEETMRAIFKYNTDLFAPATIERMTGHFATLLVGIIETPDARLGELPLLTAPEHQQLLITWNNTQNEELAFPRTQLIHQVFEAQVELTPEAVAVSYWGDRRQKVGDARGETLTYHMLNQRSNQLAHYLQALGVGPDVLVGVCLERTPDLVVALLAVLKAGGAYIPMDPSYPAERLAYLTEDADPHVLLTQSNLLTRLPVNASLLALDEAWPTIAEQPDHNPAPTAQLHNLSYVIYTSGSTGKPKGTLIEHRGLSNYLAWAVQAYAVADGDGAPVNSSIGFDATITSFFSPLLTGGKVVLLPEADEIEALAAALTGDEHFSLVKITPAHLEILSHLVTDVEGNVPPINVNAFIIGGEALHGHQLAFWQRHAPHTRLINEYGPTETVVGCCIYEAQELITGPVAIGRPIANTELYILDQYQQPVPVGVPGELYIGGVGVARGYLNREELTGLRFMNYELRVADCELRVSGDTATEACKSQIVNRKLYKTGDLARYLPAPKDGGSLEGANIEYLGRLDHQVKIRGYRIELGEIEAVLADHPGVEEVAVSAHTDAVGTKSLVAYLIAEDVTPAELRHYLREQLPDYMIPSHFVLLDAFPLTTNGKLDRAALPAPSEERSEQRFVPPRDAVEMKLAPLWESVLDVHPIGVHEDFFDLGGNSLLAVRLTARIQQSFGKSVPLSALFQHGTVEQLANLLRQTTDGEPMAPSSVVVPMQSTGNKPPFFCVPGAGGYVIYLYQLAQALGTDQPFYGLQAAGLEEAGEPHSTVEAMATYYLEAIQSVQPEGPYYLGGHSLGSWVAFEMAQQLQRQGHDVALVAIIDTPAPDLAVTTDLTTRDEARWITELAYRIKHLLAPTLDVDEATLQSFTRDEQLRYLQEQLMAVDLFPAEVGLEQLERLLAIFKAHSQVTYTIPDDAMPMPLTIFHTTAEGETAQGVENTGFIAIDDRDNDESWGWSTYGPTKVYKMPGDHLSILNEPHVHELAASLTEALTGAWASVSSEPIFNRSTAKVTAERLPLNG